jgi:hypothetical protein
MSLPPLLRRFVLAGLVAAAALAASLAIPHDPYIRWQDVRSEAWARLGWVYERIHFDRTPIDIAFIGTSHSMNGIDGAAVQAALAEAGGGCRRVVNFAMPAYGRNLHWLIARELLEHREVRTLVLEVMENESRKAHPVFHSVANVMDVLDAPVFINLNFASDIAHLPARQAMLGLKSLLPDRFGLRPTFDPARYDGPDVDNTRRVQVGGVPLTPLRDAALPRDRLERQAAQARAGKDGNMLGARLEALEYRFARHYLGLILDLARARGVTVKFLYLPSYAFLQDRPRDALLYARHGEVLAPGAALAEPGYWGDLHHLNLHGAAVLSARLGTMLATMPGATAAAKAADTTAGCEAAGPDVLAARGR